MKIIAHRGASALAPENTLAAFRLALQSGTHGLELDVRLTRDHRLAVLHDPDTRRTAPRQPRLRAASSTLAQLQSLDVGSWKSPAYAGHRIPALEDVLALLPSDREVFIEIKSRETPRLLAALDRLLAPSAPRGVAARRVVVMSFHAAVVRAVKQHRPAWRVLRLLHARPSARWLDCFLADIRAGRLDGLGQNRAWSLPLAHYAALRDAGALLSVWTVNDPAEARLWRARGFHYLTTDIPEKFLRHSRP